MAVIVKGNGSANLPHGWVIQSDTDVENGRRRIVATGPYESVEAAREALIAEHDKIFSPSVTHQPGSPTATIEFYLKGQAWKVGEGNEPEPILPDRWDLSPATEQVALEANPAFEDVTAAINAALDRLARGDIAGAAAVCRGGAENWLALYMAGVRTYQATAYQYKYTRTYAYADADKVKNKTSTLAQQNGRVYAWSDVEGSDDCPTAEPKWLGADNVAHSYEWRLDGVSVSAVEDSEVVLTYAYTGAWKWAKALYPGGSWEPEPVE